MSITSSHDGGQGGSRRGPGRPRDPDVSSRVLDVTRELLKESGYAKLAIDAVARRAGVTRATVYRRWPSRIELIYNAVFPEDEAAPLHDSLGLRADLRLLLQLAVSSYGSPAAVAATPGLLADLHQDPALRARLQDPMRRKAKEQFAGLLDIAQARGDLRVGVDASAAFDALVGAVFFRLAHGEKVSDTDLDALTDLVLNGVANCRDAG